MAKYSLRIHQASRNAPFVLSVGIYLLKVVSIAPIKLEWAFEDLLEGPDYSIKSFPYGRRKFFA
jgi:hypothetical protein